MCTHGIHCLPPPKAAAIPQRAGAASLGNAPPFFAITIDVRNFTTRTLPPEGMVVMSPLQRELHCLLAEFVGLLHQGCQS